MVADRRGERPRTGGARPPQPRASQTGRRSAPRGEQTAGRDRPRSGGSRREPASGLPQTGQDRRDQGARDQDRRSPDRPGPDTRPAPPARTREAARPGLAKPEREPQLPEDVDTRTLHRAVRAELRSLPRDLAETVAGHLVMAGRLVDEEPELAYAHAEAARRRAARLPIVREAAAETAYAAGRYDVALSEFRALRRMTGSDDYLPVMADCERALGRPQNALKLAREAARRPLDPALRVEMTMVEAGARADLDQHAEAQRVLERAQPGERPGPGLELPYARLRYAYADVLLRAGRTDEARDWFARAAGLDPEQETDAAGRVDELDGFLIDFDEGPEEE